jgi:hypothetical protein
MHTTDVAINHAWRDRGKSIESNMRAMIARRNHRAHPHPCLSVHDRDLLHMGKRPGPHKHSARRTRHAESSRRIPNYLTSQIHSNARFRNVRCQDLRWQIENERTNQHTVERVDMCKWANSNHRMVLGRSIKRMISLARENEKGAK